MIFICLYSNNYLGYFFIWLLMIRIILSAFPFSLFSSLKKNAFWFELKNNKKVTPLFSPFISRCLKRRGFCSLWPAHWSRNGHQYLEQQDPWQHKRAPRGQVRQFANQCQIRHGSPSSAVCSDVTRILPTLQTVDQLQLQVNRPP